MTKLLKMNLSLWLLTALVIAAMTHQPPKGYTVIAVDFDGVINAYYEAPQKSFSCWIGFYSSPPSYYVGRLDRTVDDWKDHCYTL
ncbi:hypothetical protein EXT67_20495 [Pectobacterium atrosepticum]|nr:hypothetical protein [Pectobacterium atrosepticum]MCL6318686.1 hypothetical protein [Pectobacterium atrosepticum]